MNSISLLAHTSPPWVDVVEQQSAKLIFKANPPSRSGVPGARSYDLMVVSGAEALTVSEIVPGTLVPAFCVERHINPGSTFCLYLNSEHFLRTLDQARYWWSGLQAYLQHQQYAEKFRRWPLDGQMSHGTAANIQLQMEERAAEVGWKQEIAGAIFRKKGWLGGKLPRLTKGGKALVNARSHCPRGCLRKHHPYRKSACTRLDCLPDCRKQHPPILRADCPHRSSVEALVRLEHQRREIDALVIEELRRTGYRCCGTMKDCPLAAGQAINA
jgi:hypothetical protein